MVTKAFMGHKGEKPKYGKEMVATSALFCLVLDYLMITNASWSLIMTSPTHTVYGKCLYISKVAIE